MVGGVEHLEHPLLREDAWRHNRKPIPRALLAPRQNRALRMFLEADAIPARGQPDIVASIFVVDQVEQEDRLVEQERMRTPSTQYRIVLVLHPVIPVSGAGQTNPVWRSTDARVVH